MAYLIGIISGFIFLVAYWRAPRPALAQAAFLALAVMLAIYIGAHLVADELSRIITETVFALGVLGIALFLRDRWPIGLGGLILAHGLYDFTFGHSAGVAPWYPPLCVGFDVTVGLGLILRFYRHGAVTR